MNIFEKVLDELHVFQAKPELLHWERLTLKHLRHRIKLILPFWNTCFEGYWGRIRTIYTDKYQLDVAAHPYLFQSFSFFLKCWTERLGCSNYFGSCESTDICLWHSAIDFYTCNLSEEQQHNIKHHGLLPTEKEELVWIKFSESVLENLHYADTLYYQYDTDKEQTRAITERLDSLRSVRKSVLKWSFEAVEEIKAHVIVVYESFEILFRRAAYFLFMFDVYESTKKTRSELSILKTMVNSAQLQAKAVYLGVLQALKLTHGNGHSLACETLLSFIDDLQNILKTLLEDLPSSHKPVEIRDIVLELGFIRSIVEHTLEQPVESGVSYAITAHVNILASQASGTLNVKYTAEEIPDFNTCDSNFRNLFYAQQKITDVRNNFRIKIRSYDVASCYVDDLLSYIRFIKEDDVSGKTPLANHFSEISLLHTFMKDTEYLIGLNPELNDMYNQIGRMFCGAWWDLQSLCFKNMNANESELSTLLLDFLKGVTANMSRPDELFVVLIRPLVQMPDTNYLLHHFHEAIAPAKEDKLFANILYSRRSNLVKLMESDAISNLLKDTNVDGIEAAHIYDLFIRELKDDASSSMEERVDCFKASVKQAYVEYLKLSEMELSELEFFDMMLSLAEFKESDASFTIGTPQQIGVLHDDLVICDSVIRCYTTKHNIPAEVKKLWTRILKLGCQVKNILDTLEQQLFSVWFSKLWLFSVTEEVKLIKEKISRIDTFKIGVGLSELSVQNKPAKLRATEYFNDDPFTQDEGQILRFEEEDTLTAKLTTGSRSLEKIAIVGMPGLGKTTLAMNLYKGCVKSFHAHAWCFVGQELHRKDLLRDITSQISERPISEINAMREEDLKMLLKQSLVMKNNYLIVLDDVWDVDAWNALRVCFPLGENGSRILLTSRFKTIGVKVCGDMNVIELELLSTVKSWNLLQKKAFGAKKCPQNLSQIGERIAKKCGGLPLSIVVIAGVLKNKEKTENSWYEVAASLDTYLVDGVSSTLELSYNHLSVSMKQCFLYCITFLKGKEIPRSKLVQIWLAERFVGESDQQESSEAAAEKHLSDLVDRSLLMVEKRGWDNRVQTCRIHDLLRDFCVQKAKEENFIITMNGWDDSACPLRYPRLWFNSSQSKFLEFICNEKSRIIRSLTTITFVDAWWELCDTSFIFENFKSLTLLNLEGLEKNNTFSESVGGLKLLRYLAVRGSIKSIPSTIGDLLNLETLIVKGTRGEVEVPETIFKLSKLRHLVVNPRARVSVEHQTRNSLRSLQSFSTPALSRSTGEQIIIRLPNLRKLRCIFLEESSDLSILDRLCHLESLKVFYYSLDKFSGKLSFPSSLCKLTLSKFRLPWSEIEKIATLLPRLEILKLLFKAFEGHQWTPTATFGKLKYLRMEELDIEEWEASDDNFPLLERLVVRRCKLLHGIPEELGNIGDLKGIEAHWCKESVAKSVLKIKKQQSDNMELKIIIYPTVLDLDDDDDDDEELSE